MPKQPPLNLYGKGVVKTRAGHLRYSSPKALRHTYVHRKVIADLIEETPYSVRLLLPWPYEVHHQDYNKINNEPSNLVMVSESLHSAMTADRPRGWGGKFGRKGRPTWTRMPEWAQEALDLMENL
jgi:hypothetical protein